MVDYTNYDDVEEESPTLETSDDESSEYELTDIEVEEDDVAETLDMKQISDYNKEIIIVKPENRITSSILSRYETTELVSIRATQISQYNNCMVDISGLDDPVKQAQRELMMRMCPLTLRRYIGDSKNTLTGQMESYYEYWDPNTMQFTIQFEGVM